MGNSAQIYILKVAEPYYHITYTCTGGLLVEVTLLYDPFKNTVDIIECKEIPANAGIAGVTGVIPIHNEGIINGLRPTIGN